MNRWLDTVPEHRESSPFLLPNSLIISGFPVRWGSEASKKNRVVLLQSVFLRCQFHETQFHVHRIFALRDPPDPELSAPSMIVCKNSAKECIAIVDSVKDLIFTSLHCCGLMVRPDPSLPSQWFNADLETHLHFHRIPDNSFLENWRHRRRFAGVSRYRGRYKVGGADLRKVCFMKCCGLLTQRLTVCRWRTSSCLRYALSVLAIL